MRAIVLTLGFLVINFAQASSLAVNPAHSKLSEALKAGDIKTLIKRAGDIVEEQPQDGRAWYFLGLGQLQLEQHTECAKSFAKAVELLNTEKPFLFAALIYQGSCAQRAGHAVEAEGSLRHVLNLLAEEGNLNTPLPPERIDGPINERWLTYGQALIALNQHALALPWIEHHLAAHPNSVAGRLARAQARLAMGDFTGALGDVRRYRTLAKDETDDHAVYIEAYAAFGAGDPEAARQTLDRAKGDVSEARLVFRYLAGDVAAGVDIAGQPKIGVGFQPASKGVEVNAVVAGSAADAAGLQKGDVLTRLDGKAIEADKFLGIIRSLKPGQTVTVNYRRGGDEKSAKMTVKARGDQPGGWQTEYRQWPTTSRVFGRVEALQEAEAAKRAGDKRAELRHLADAFRHSPNDVALLKRIAALTASLKPPPAVSDEARRLAESANQDAGSSNPPTLAGAAAAYQQAIGQAPWWGDLYVNLGLIEEKLGRFTDAKRHFEMFLIVTPNAPEAAVVRRKINEMDFRGIMKGE